MITLSSQHLVSLKDAQSRHQTLWADQETLRMKLTDREKAIDALRLQIESSINTTEQHKRTIDGLQQENSFLINQLNQHKLEMQQLRVRQLKSHCCLFPHSFCLTEILVYFFHSGWVSPTPVWPDLCGAGEATPEGLCVWAEPAPQTGEAGERSSRRTAGAAARAADQSYQWEQYASSVGFRTRCRWYQNVQILLKYLSNLCLKLLLSC